MDNSQVLGVATLLVATIGAIIAIAQIRSANRAEHKSRMAEMSWQVYQAYTDTKIRDARGAAEYIAHTEFVPSSGAEYGKKYADKKIIVADPKKLSLDTHMRRLLRFYNQTGILLEKKLVDEDLIFGLLGPGLKTCWSAIGPAIEWYQNYEFGLSGYEKVERRPIHAYVINLYQRYLKWEVKNKKKLLSK